MDVFRDLFDKYGAEYKSNMAAIGADLSWWFPKEEAMSSPFAGLVPGRHVFYEHASEKTLGAVVAKVLDAETGRINLALLLGSGMWINMREVEADPSCGGTPVPSVTEGFVTNRWRWMEPKKEQVASAGTPAAAEPPAAEQKVPALE